MKIFTFVEWIFLLSVFNTKWEMLRKYQYNE